MQITPTLSIWTRLVVLTICLSLWLVVFFSINNLSGKSRRLYDFSTQLDCNLPFLPNFFWAYLSAYAFVIFPFFLISDTGLYVRVISGYILVSVICMLIHIFFPSRVIRVEQVEPVEISKTPIFWFQKLCKPHGNFPSMHAGYGVILVLNFFLFSDPLLASIVLLWEISILLSTLFTKQHYVLDVLSGLFVGIICAVIPNIAIITIL